MISKVHLSDKASPQLCGHLPATPIDVEPTDRQRAAHELAAAFGAAGEVDWAVVDANFRALADAAGYESPLIEIGKNSRRKNQRGPADRTGTSAGRPRCRALRAGAHTERQAA